MAIRPKDDDLMRPIKIILIILPILSLVLSANISGRDGEDQAQEEMIESKMEIIDNELPLGRSLAGTYLIHF